MVPVERSELGTQDMDVLADLVRQLYFDHTASFRCPDPAAVGIAAAAGVTARALHCTFRRYYGTVRAVASRWGWVSHSRFAVAYQQRFGVLPSRTLRS